jgi:hypothetical protein
VAVLKKVRLVASDMENIVSTYNSGRDFMRRILGHDSLVMTNLYCGVATSTPPAGNAPMDCPVGGAWWETLQLDDPNLLSVIEAWTAFASLRHHTPGAQDEIKRVRAAGVEALKRLLPMALRDTGQSRVIARFSSLSTTETGSLLT